ncbi:RNA polymerase sigma-70 factor [Nonlabens sp. YIK11]|uniref:RNA polymerase sigma factor n=1 Tax=Nonlabens sp. YIK11 TaxID=1453349 RepID=UPI0006DBF08A|nr:RNA polymerase sigma factor [Nonlabens sp. YIK11]KQC32295.1 RNA polymerase sigma-70 factor [Nonlabens sp. YIK11]
MVQQQILEGCRKGDRKAQRALYDQYAASLYGCCLKYASNEQEAQDILQDSFITIFEKIQQFKNEGSLEGWCKRIAINTALQRYRGAKVYLLEDEQQLVEEVPVVEYMEQLGLEDLLAMVQQLPDRYRMVFSLYALDGFSHQEIAELMDIREGTSKSNLSRARVSLQQMIQAWRRKMNSDAI